MTKLQKERGGNAWDSLKAVVHSFTVKEMDAILERNRKNPQVIEDVRKAETSNPRHSGGRVGVLRKISEIQLAD